MERLKTNFESLTNEAIDNIRADREQTQELLKDLYSQTFVLQFLIILSTCFFKGIRLKKIGTRSS